MHGWQRGCISCTKFVSDVSSKIIGSLSSLVSTTRMPVALMSAVVAVRPMKLTSKSESMWWMMLDAVLVALASVHVAVVTRCVTSFCSSVPPTVANSPASSVAVASIGCSAVLLCDALHPKTL